MVNIEYLVHYAHKCLLQLLIDVAVVLFPNTFGRNVTGQRPILGGIKALTYKYGRTATEDVDSWNRYRSSRLSWGCQWRGRGEKAAEGMLRLSRN